VTKKTKTPNTPASHISIDSRLRQLTQQAMDQFRTKPRRKQKVKR